MPQQQDSPKPETSFSEATKTESIIRQEQPAVSGLLGMGLAEPPRS